MEYIDFLFDVISPGSGGGGREPVIASLTATENGTYTAPAGVDGYSPVTVAVPGPIVEAEENDVIFIDYDGKILYSYSKEEFLQLETFPANPDHTDAGLVAEGWNWSLAGAKAFVAQVGYCDIGQVYTTASGVTEFDISVDAGSYELMAPSTNEASSTTDYEIDWGDGSSTSGTAHATTTIHNHTYSAAGDYTIKITIDDDTVPVIMSEPEDCIAARFAGNVLYNMTSDDSEVRYITLPNGTRYSFLRETYMYELSGIVFPLNFFDGVSSITIGNWGCKYISMPEDADVLASVKRMPALRRWVSTKTSDAGGSTSIPDTSLLPSIQLVAFPDAEGYGAVNLASCAVGSVLKVARFPKGAASVGANNQTKLQKVDLNGALSLAGSAFYKTGLESIQLPEGIPSIPMRAFYECNNLARVNIPVSVTTIGQEAFYHCTSLTELTIPQGVTSIGIKAFQGCSQLTAIHVQATTPPALANWNALTGTNDCPIYVPVGSLAAFQSATNWSNAQARIQEEPA